MHRTCGAVTASGSDAVLHSDFEVIWLLLRQGELLLNERDDLRPRHRLALVAHPYRRETRTFPEPDPAGITVPAGSGSGTRVATGRSGRRRSR
ncbi:SitI3 family protein [Saccharothrix variisporea]|uniref:SitI3 family protein n=1 Tax=Saccharothrix variisporea TaxID=543527 RepID=UPI001FE6D057|nr:SitI3 family protein [Saccharothrix variisporea]